MNVDSIKTALTQKTGRAGLYLQKHSPEILLGVGLVGMVATVVMASKATLKVSEVIQSHNELMTDINDNVDVNTENPVYSQEDATKDKVTVYVETGLKLAKLYGPSVGVGVLSLAAILGAHGIMAKRQVALTAAYGLLAEGYKAYRDRVVEELGEEKDRQYHLGLREETYTIKETDPEGKTTKTKKTALVTTDNVPSMYARCFDSSNPMYRSERLLNAAFLEAQQRYLNDELLINGHLFLNRVYERLGFPETSYGQLVGWVLKDPIEMAKEKRDGYVSFGLEKWKANREFMRGENDAIWLDFNVDGIVYDII